MSGVATDWVVVVGIVLNTIPVYALAYAWVRLCRATKQGEPGWMVWYASVRPRWGLPLHGQWVQMLLCLLALIEIVAHSMTATRPAVVYVDGQNLQVIDFYGVSIDPAAYEVAYILFLLDRMSIVPWTVALFGMRSPRRAATALLLHLVIVFTLTIVCLAGVWGPISVLLSVRFALLSYLLLFSLYASYYTDRHSAGPSYQTTDGSGYAVPPHDGTFSLRDDEMALVDVN